MGTAIGVILDINVKPGSGSTFHLSCRGTERHKTNSNKQHKKNSHIEEISFVSNFLPLLLSLPILLLNTNPEQ
jgi:hypothetical protein